MAKCRVYMQAQASIMSLPVMDAPSIQHTLRKNSAAEKWNGKQASASTQQLKVSALMTSSKVEPRKFHENSSK